MRIDVRSTAVAAGVAFGLSALIGVIGGVQFGVLLLRALLIGALFGGGAIGVGFLIERFLPELKSIQTRPSSDEAGGTVDIVVDDDPLEDEPLPAQLPEDQDIDDSEQVDELEEESEGGESEGEESGDTPAFEPGIAAAEVVTGGESEEDVEELAEADEATALPDMERMQESFAAPADDESSGTSETNSLGGDPSMYAQAIRTALKRDEG